MAETTFMNTDLNEKVALDDSIAATNFVFDIDPTAEDATYWRMGTRAATEPQISGLVTDHAQRTRQSSAYRPISLVLPHQATETRCDIATTRIYSDHELYQRYQQYANHSVGESHPSLSHTDSLMQNGTTAKAQIVQHLYHTL